MTQNRSADWRHLVKWTTNGVLFVFVLITGLIFLRHDAPLSFGSVAYYVLAGCLALLFLLRYLLQAIATRETTGPIPVGRGERR